METTRLSSKGQVVIPKAIRAAHGWDSGAEFVVEETGEGILLKPVRLFPPTSVCDVLGCAGYRGPPKTLADMEAAVAEGARRSR
jgi:AbrB family looped-hinge helix DNA binding protein